MSSSKGGTRAQAAAALGASSVCVVICVDCAVCYGTRKREQKAKGGKIHVFVELLWHPLVSIISPTHERSEGRVPVWGSEFTTKVAPKGGSA
jgi:hypothetical protein